MKDIFYVSLILITAPISIPLFIVMYAFGAFPELIPTKVGSADGGYIKSPPYKPLPKNKDGKIKF